MRRQSIGKGRMSAVRGYQIWTLFGLLLVALICSAVVGTRTVRASGCGTVECVHGNSFATNWCVNNGHGPLIRFWCPYPLETDDFGFQCSDGDFELYDCGTRNPS